MTQAEQYNKDFLKAGISFSIILPPHPPHARHCDDCQRVIPNTEERVALTKVIWRRRNADQRLNTVRDDITINLHVTCANNLGDYMKTRTGKRTRGKQVATHYELSHEF